RDSSGDGSPGCLAPPGDAAAKAGRLALLARRPDLRDRLGGAGREMVRSTFPLDGMIRHMEDLYARLVP
ncbi:MAG: glycosyltransferase family 1 protein, partial [Planctomycetes bacterium]|nr:glycosyltransferase family 1 protein [Planctomycetota bacterium]